MTGLRTVTFFSLQSPFTLVSNKFCILIINMSWYKINSNRGHPLLVVDNYIHRIDRSNENNEYYKYIDNCGGRAILRSQMTAIISKIHNHSTHGAELARRGFRETLKVKEILYLLILY